MLRDRFNGEHSGGSRDAIAAYEAAAREFLSHRPATGAWLDRALTHDPDHVASLALKGFGHVLLGKNEHIASARIMARRVGAFEKSSMNPRERMLAVALKSAAHGRMLQASDILAGWLTDAPHDLIAFKLAHALRFMAGDQAGLLALSTGLVDQWSADIPGFGFLLGCHAFALEEQGLYRTAERTAVRGLALEPGDAWGLHAISHVHTMEGRHQDGINWLRRTQPVWTKANNFAFHLWWHLALLHFGRGDSGQALALYDAEIRPHLNDDFRDIANAVSLLWRMREEGVEIGDRFCDLHSYATLRARDATLVFGSLHHLLSLIANDDAPGIQALLHALTQSAGRPDGDQSTTANDIGVELARALASLTLGQVARADVARLARNASRIGGSHEQRDVFLRTLALIAADEGDDEGAQAVLAIRARLKKDLRFPALVARRLEAGLAAKILREAA
jgi:hypothetical protein